MQMRIWLALSLALFVACGTQKQAESPAKTNWQVLEASDQSEPIARHEASYVKVGDKFVLLGGRDIRPVSIFDPQLQIWEQGQKPPLELHHLQAIEYDNKAWIMGALTGPYPGETPVPHIYTYDPQADLWEQGPEIPAERQRGSAGVAVYQGKIYLVCGIKDGHRGDHKRWLDEYNPATGEWRVLPDAPRARDHFQASVVGDQLIVVGGRRSRAPDSTMLFPVAEVDVFDFKTETWATWDHDLPTLRGGTYNAIWGNEVIVLGGESPDQVPAHSEMEALDLKTHQWRSLAPMLEGRHGTGAILHEGSLYVASGSGNRGGGPELTSQEFYSFEGKK